MKTKVLTKKFFATVAVCIMMFACALTLMACGGGNNKKDDAYTQISTLFETIQSEKTSDGMFVTRTDNGVESQFALNYYFAHETFNYYNRLFVIPMNYLFNNYESLARLEKIEKISSAGQKAINNFSESTQKLAQSYRASYEKFKIYLKLKQHSGNQVVLDGALTIYKGSLRQMFDDVYASALALVDIQDKALDDFASLEITDRELTSADATALRDLFVLRLANDFYKVMIVNLEMADYGKLAGNAQIREFASIFAKIKTGAQELLKVQAISNFANLSGIENTQTNTWTNQKVTEFFEMEQKMDSERKLLDKSLKKFNLKDFYNDFLCDVDNYSNKVPHAAQYYQEIENYFTDWTTLYMTYLQTNLGE